MRKYLIAAVAALTALAFTAVALRPESGAEPSLTTKSRRRTPARREAEELAGSSSTRQRATRSRRRCRQLDIYFPKSSKLSIKGLPSCDHSSSPSAGPERLPSRSKAGTGEATRRSSASTARTPRPLKFNVTAFKRSTTGKTCSASSSTARPGAPCDVRPEGDDQEGLAASTATPNRSRCRTARASSRSRHPAAGPGRVLGLEDRHEARPEEGQATPCSPPSAARARSTRSRSTLHLHRQPDAAGASARQSTATSKCCASSHAHPRPSDRRPRRWRGLRRS